MNKHVRRFATALLAVLLLLQAMGICALAADDDAYQIRIYAGNVGATINGNSVWTFTGHYGDPIPFNTGMVSLPEGSRYYVKGVRESGLDNDMVSALGVVREDADYVVAYGIKGKLVAYTVSFVDENGSQLAPPQTYYGNAGDKPVVAYLYVDGYQPQAYNLTKTLSENESSNVFQFVYTPIVRPTLPSATPGPTITPAPAEPGSEGNGSGAETEPTAVPETETEPTVAPTAGPESNTETETTAAPEDETEPTAAPEEERNEPTEAPAPAETPEEPQEIIDLDEGDTPLGNAPLGNAPETGAKEEKTDLQKIREQTQAKFYVSAGMVAVALIALVTAAVLLLKRRGTKH